jgi:hypothetical protein
MFTIPGFYCSVYTCDTGDCTFNNRDMRFTEYIGICHSPEHWAFPTYTCRGGGGQVTTPLFFASLNATKQQDTPLLTALAVIIMQEMCIRGGQQTVTFVEKPAETIA